MSNYIIGQPIWYNGIEGTVVQPLDGTTHRPHKPWIETSKYFHAIPVHASEILPRSTEEQSKSKTLEQIDIVFITYTVHGELQTIHMHNNKATREEVSAFLHSRHNIANDTHRLIVIKEIER